jgi:Mg/Co/Ni transporter MgtE
MKPINIEIDKNQLIKIFKKLDVNDKIEIFNELKKSLYLKRFNALLRSTRTNELTLEDITREVESVRENRYAKGKQNF